MHVGIAGDLVAQRHVGDVGAQQQSRAAADRREQLIHLEVSGEIGCGVTQRGEPKRSPTVVGTGTVELERELTQLLDPEPFIVILGCGE